MARKICMDAPSSRMLQCKGLESVRSSQPVAEVNRAWATHCKRTRFLVCKGQHLHSLTRGTPSPQLYSHLGLYPGQSCSFGLLLASAPWLCPVDRQLISAVRGSARWSGPHLDISCGHLCWLSGSCTTTQPFSCLPAAILCGNADASSVRIWKKRFIHSICCTAELSGLRQLLVQRDLGAASAPYTPSGAKPTHLIPTSNAFAISCSGIPWPVTCTRSQDTFASCITSDEYNIRGQAHRVSTGGFRFLIWLERAYQVPTLNWARR